MAAAGEARARAAGAECGRRLCAGCELVVGAVAPPRLEGRTAEFLRPRGGRLVLVQAFDVGVPESVRVGQPIAKKKTTCD